MSQSFTTASLQSLVAYPFQDSDWKGKFLIGSLLGAGGFLIPIIPWIFLAGYFDEIMRRIILERQEPSLPEWEDWGRFFASGLRLSGAGFIYSLPSLVLMLAGYSFIIAPAFFTNFLYASGRPVFPDFANWQAASTLIGVAGIVAALVVGIGFGIFLPAVLGHVVATQDFGAAFRAGEWWPVFRANLAGFILTYLILMGFSYAISFAIQFLMMTIVLCLIFPLVLGPIYYYLGLISTAMFAQAYRAGVENLGPPLVPETAPV